MNLEMSFLRMSKDGVDDLIVQPSLQTNAPRNWL